MTSTPPAKRQRTEEDTVKATDHGDKQKSYLWFDDGNVVLQAEKTLFRVHKSILSLHSEVFSDMFRLPLPSDDASHGSQPMFEQGCPLIFLSDSAGDVTRILSSIYENHKKYDYRDSMDTVHVAALFRLGNKYGMEYLRQEAFNRLKKEFPSSLEDWDRSFDWIDDGIAWEGADDVSSLSISANLAYEHNIQIVLPAIYVALSRYGNKTLLSMKKENDLNPRLFETCLIGKEKLMADTLHYLSSLSRTDLDPMQNCSHVIWGIAEAIHLKGGVRSLDPLDKLCQNYSNICENCYSKIEKIHEEMRQKLWSNLPSFFGLPDWTELDDS